MNYFFWMYMVLWGTACLLAVVLMIRLRAILEIFQCVYWQHLFQRWKVISFFLAATGITLISPYTGDPTWDYVDAIFMSVLTYTTAPWAVGICYLTIRGKRSFKHLYIAVCVWMFSASWSYDLYLVFRDGVYPLTWFANIPASSILYLSAGLLWSLEYVEGRGVVFGFMDQKWPAPAVTNNFIRISLYALPLMFFVIAIIIPFLLQVFYENM